MDNKHETWQRFTLKMFWQNSNAQFLNKKAEAVKYLSTFHSVSFVNKNKTMQHPFSSEFHSHINSANYNNILHLNDRITLNTTMCHEFGMRKNSNV